MPWLRFVLACATPLFAIEFERDVLPLLEANCVKCHAGPAAQAGLDLRSRATILGGGKSGPAAVPHKADASLLARVLREGKMPPGGKADPALVRAVDQWIEAGAPARDPEAKPADRAHWAFRAPVRPAIPAARAQSAIRTPVDAFVIAALEKRGLSLSPAADKPTLLRRVTFDLTGLPPTPAELDAFLADRAPDAYDRVVERLLASEHYGERQARHWLDAAGYADSEGVLAADVIRPNAYRYRDYVIRAFNRDLPFDQFVREQLAGDELAQWRNPEKPTGRAVEQIEATGFLRTAVDATRADFQPSDFAEYTWRTTFDTQQIVASSLLGLTMHCARCHDHRYEPLSQTDYYRFLALFRGALRPDGAVLPSLDRVIVEASETEKKHAAAVNKPLDDIVKALRDLRAARVKQYRALHPKGDKATEAELGEMFPEFAKAAADLTAELAREEARRVKLPTIRALYDLDAAPPPMHVFQRGDPLKPGERVEPGVPAVLDDPARPFLAPTPAKDAWTTGRRTALADWLARADHPLTARVMVNRVWASHFGTGIVATLDNFGRSGAAPTHPELLDWLAVEFAERGWSVKDLHRVMVRSSAYRQASASRPDARKADPENKLLWRMRPRRLEAEAVRDAMLFAAGTLDPKMYGEAVAAKTKPSGEVVPDGEDCKGRRSIYQIVRRSAPQSLLSAFDAPVMEINCARRVQSTSATQALALMNSDFAAAVAGHFADRVMRERTSGRAEYAFRLALGREPSPSEKDTLASFGPSQKDSYPELDGVALEWRLLADLCQSLLASNEFVYVD